MKKRELLYCDECGCRVGTCYPMEGQKELACKIIELLMNDDKGCMTLRDIYRGLNKRKHDVVTVMKTLEEDGYVHKETAIPPGGGRRSIVYSINERSLFEDTLDSVYNIGSYPIIDALKNKYPREEREKTEEKTSSSINHNDLSSLLGGTNTFDPNESEEILRDIETWLSIRNSVYPRRWKCSVVEEGSEYADIMPGEDGPWFMLQLFGRDGEQLHVCSTCLEAIERGTLKTMAKYCVEKVSPSVNLDDRPNFEALKGEYLD